LLTDVAANVVTQVFRSYLSEQAMDHLSTTLRKGGIKDLLVFFPGNKRENKVLDEHFRKAGLPAVSEWWIKKQYAFAKEAIITTITESAEREDAPADVGPRESNSVARLD
jgi:hypothetical protein